MLKFELTLTRFWQYHGRAYIKFTLALHFSVIRAHIELAIILIVDKTLFSFARLI